MTSPDSSGQQGASRLERLAWILGAGAGLGSLALSPLVDLAWLAYVGGALTIYAISLRSQRVHRRGGLQEALVPRTLAVGGKLVIAILAVGLLVFLASEILKETMF